MSETGRPKPFAPHGVVDGFVCDTNLAKKMSLICRFGNSCGIPFKKDIFFKKHRQWQKFEPYIKDRPTQPWTEFTITNKEKMESNTEKKNTKTSNTKTKSKFKLTKKRNTKKNFEKMEEERTKE
jgi:hypothetical protein